MVEKVGGMCGMMRIEGEVQGERFLGHVCVGDRL